MDEMYRVGTSGFYSAIEDATHVVTNDGVWFQIHAYEFYNAAGYDFVAFCDGVALCYNFNDQITLVNKRSRRYLRIRSLVRAAFWTLILLAGILASVLILNLVWDLRGVKSL